jgi:hypothetical protein
MTGLRVNLSKLVKVGTVSDVERLAMALGCKVCSSSKTYLGLSLGSHFKVRSMWMALFRGWRHD